MNETIVPIQKENCLHLSNMLKHLLIFIEKMTHQNDFFNEKVFLLYLTL